MSMTMNGNAPLILFSNATKTFGRADGNGQFVAVDKLNFSVDRGEIVVVLGKTGCGKSTMFNLIAGLTEPSSGQVSVLGHDPFREFGFFAERSESFFKETVLCHGAARSITCCSDSKS